MDRRVLVSSLIGQIPPEIRSIIEERIPSTGRYPVSEDDTLKLIQSRRSVALCTIALGETKMTAMIEYFYVPPSPPAIELRPRLRGAIELSYQSADGLVHYNLLDYSLSSLKSSISDLFDCDIHIDLEKAEHRLLDVKSVFVILKGRFRALGLDNPANLARTRTEEYVNNVISLCTRHGRGFDYVALESWLLASVTSMELEAPQEESLWRGDYGKIPLPRVLDGIAERSRVYLDLISEAIDHLI